MTRPRLVAALLLVPLALSGCAAPDAPQPAATDAPPAGHAPRELHRETFDFTRSPRGDVRSPVDVPPGLSALVVTVAWSAATGVALGDAKVQLEDPDRTEAAECALPPGAPAARTCEARVDAPPSGRWSIEFEGASPGLRAEVVLAALPGASAA